MAKVLFSYIRKKKCKKNIQPVFLAFTEMPNIWQILSPRNLFFATSLSNTAVLCHPPGQGISFRPYNIQNQCLIFSSFAGQWQGQDDDGQRSGRIGHRGQRRQKWEKFEKSSRVRKKCLKKSSRVRKNCLKKKVARNIFARRTIILTDFCLCSLVNSVFTAFTRLTLYVEFIRKYFLKNKDNSHICGQALT